MDSSRSKPSLLQPLNIQPPITNEGVAPVILEGWLAKRCRGVATKVWYDRYFFLRGRTLSYFMEPTDETPRGIFHLSSSCAVSDIYLRDTRKLSKMTTDSPALESFSSSDDKATSTTAAAATAGTPLGVTKSHETDPSNSLYCIEITWLKHNHAADAESSHRLITMESLPSNKSTSTAVTRFIDPDSSTPPIVEHVEPVSTSTTDTDSCPPTPVTEHKSNRKISITQPNADIQSSNAIPPPRHPLLYSTFRRRKYLQKQNHLDSSASSNNVSQTASVLPKSPLRFKNRPEVVEKGGHSSPVPELFLPDLGSSSTDDGFHVGKQQSSSSDAPLEYKDQTDPLSTSTSGPSRHYTQQMEELQRKIQLRNDTRLRFEKLQLTQKQTQQKQKRVKRLVRTGEYVAAVGGAVTIGVFTAGIGWVVGLVFLCVSAAAGGSCAMAEMGFWWKKPGSKYKLVIAAESIEKIKEWKDAMEYVIASLLEEECVAIEEQQTIRNKEGDSPRDHDLLSSNVPLALKVESQGKDAIATLSTIPFSSVSRWEPLEGGWPTLLGVNSLGMRIFREESAPPDSATMMSRSFFPTSIPRVRTILRLGIQGRPSPPLKTQVIVRADPLDAFMSVMTRMNYDEQCAPSDKALVPNSGQRASFRIIETIDDNSDIIHLFFRPIYLFPVWTPPRDFVLFRYWRNESDGSYTIMYDSIEHEKCPPMEGYVRGLMNGIYTIAPPSRSKRGKQGYFRSIEDECLLTHVVQVDPRGRIPNLNLPFFASEGYTEAFAVSVLSLVLDIRDALDQARFVSVPLDDAKPPAWKEAMTRFRKSVTVSDSKALLRKYDDDDDDGAIDIEDDDNHYDPRFSIFEVRGRARTLTEGDTPTVPTEFTSSLFSTDPPTYPLNQWAEPEGNSFRVRGKSYKTDGIKINAGDSLFPLLAVDLVETESVLVGGLCSHPMERVQKALAREREAKSRGINNSDMPAFVFCVDIVLAGPPTVHMAFFYGVDDISKIDGSNGTPSSRLAKEFFFGDSDEFRNSTFKLIPRIVDGNFLVRKAAGSTPAILGKKIKQTYIRSDRFFELIVETGSNPVSAGVLRLCSSYSKYLTADMAFLLEGTDETRLPEKILGCARVKNIDLNKNVRKCPSAG